MIKGPYVRELHIDIVNDLTFHSQTKDYVHI